MPIYEYRCNSCSQSFSVFIRSFSAPETLVCTRCGRSDLRKLVSRFSVLKSEESRLESMADPSALAGVDESDPRSIARWAKKMGKEMGEDLGDDFDEMVEQMESGEMPEDMPGNEPSDDLLD